MKNNSVTSLFKKLATIKSPSGSERDIANFIKGILEDNNILYFQDEVGNIIFRVGNIDAESILLSAHMDTVPPGDNINIEESDGFIQTDGTSILGADNKASIAAILDGILSVRNKINKNIEVVFTVEEETTFKGAMNLDISSLKSKKGYLFDRSAPVGTIVISAPYANEFVITINGKAAHAGSEPEKGNNSIVAAAKLLNLLPNGRVDTYTTFNVGKIAGGSAGNDVAEKTILSGDFRSIDKKNVDNLSVLLKNAIANVEKETETIIDLQEIPIVQGYSFKEDNKFLQETISIIRAQGLKPQNQVSCGASEANEYNARGIEVLNLGDGGESPHATNERIKITELIKLRDLIVKIIVD